MPASEPKVVYSPRADASPDAERNALAACYRLILFKSNSRKKGTRPGAPDDAEESENGRTAKPNYSG